MGRLSTKQLPSQVELYYTYDSLGRLKTLVSSDQTVSYTYSYDLHDNPVEIQDHVSGNLLKRTYDFYNRLVKEELSPGSDYRICL